MINRINIAATEISQLTQSCISCCLQTEFPPKQVSCTYTSRKTVGWITFVNHCDIGQTINRRSIATDPGASRIAHPKDIWLNSNQLRGLISLLVFPQIWEQEKSTASPSCLRLFADQPHSSNARSFVRSLGLLRSD